MNKIFVVGDIHGFYEHIASMNRFVDTTDIIIQVGDFGVKRDLREKWGMLGPMKCPVFFIDGNHENFGIIDGWSKVNITEVGLNLYYVPRGYVSTFFGKRIGFLGGAESVDKTWRTPGVDWFSQEQIKREDVDRLIQNAGEIPLDILITHAAPASTIKNNFPILSKVSWGLPADWEDVSAQMVDEVYTTLKPKQLICGHMHKKVDDAGVRILDIHEIMVIE